MARIKQKPIVALDWNSSARSTSNPTPPAPLPAPGPNVLLPQPSQPATSISIPDAPSVRQASPEQPESVHAVLPSSDSRFATTEKLLRCDICNETFPGSHLQPFRDHVERCHADTTAGLDNDSDDGSPTDRLTTPPESERSETDRIPLPPAYSATEVQLYPKIHDEDDETEEAQQPQQRFRVPALTSISKFQDSLDAGEDGSPEDHLRVMVNAHDALVQIQDEYVAIDRTAKTSQYPPTLSLEDEFDMIGGRVRGVLRETIKPSMKVVNPRAKPVRSDDPEKWYPTNQFQLDQDRTEGAVYGYITKEGARDIGHQDPIGQRARGPGENRDLRARQPQRNAVRDDDSGDESGLNAVDAALLEGGRGKREKRPSNRVIGTNSRASSVERVKPVRKNAKSRLADLGADHPSAAETLDSTNRWVDDVDADDGSGASDDESGVTKPHKGPQQSYLDPKTKKNATGKKSKNVSNNGDMDDEEAAAAKAARSQKRSEGAKMGWAKRKEALAAKESTQASVNGDLDEGSQYELANTKAEPNDASDAGSNLKVQPKKKVKQMIQLADGTWIEKPSAATINMRRRWQKKREAEAKGLPPPKIGRYKKTDVILAESSSTPADFNDQENDQLLAAVDGAAANHKRKNENDEDDNDADKTIKGKKKQRRNKMELSTAMVLDDDNDTVNDDTLMDEDDETAQPTEVKKKRQAENELVGPPSKQPKTSQHNTESLASSDEEDEVTEDEMLLDPSSSPNKREDKKKKKMGKENKKKGTHIRFFQRKPELLAPLQELFNLQQNPFLVPIQDLVVFMADGGRPPRLGEFTHRGSGALNASVRVPPRLDAGAGADEDDDVDMDTETDVEDPAQRAGSQRIPSGIRPPQVAIPQESAGSYYNFMGSARPPPNAPLSCRPDAVPSQPSMDFRGPPRGQFTSMRPPPARFSGFEEPYTPSRPHPDPYHRSDPPNARPGAEGASSSGSEFASGAPVQTGTIPRVVVNLKSAPVGRPEYPVNNIRPRPGVDVRGLDAAVEVANARIAEDPALQGTAIRRSVPVPVDRPGANQSHRAPGNRTAKIQAEDQGPNNRRSGRVRRAPVRNEMVESSAIPSSSPPISRSPVSSSRPNVPGLRPLAPTSRPHRPPLSPSRMPARPALSRRTESAYGFPSAQPGDRTSQGQGTRSNAQPETVVTEYEDNGNADNGNNRASVDNGSVTRGIPYHSAAAPADMGFGGQGPATFPPDSAEAAGRRRDDVVAEQRGRGPVTFPPVFARDQSGQRGEVNQEEIHAMVLAQTPGMKAFREPNPRMGSARRDQRPATLNFVDAAAALAAADRRKGDLTEWEARQAARAAQQETQTASAARRAGSRGGSAKRSPTTTPAPGPMPGRSRRSAGNDTVPDLAHGDRSSADTQGPSTPAPNTRIKKEAKQESKESKESVPNSSGPQVHYGSGVFRHGYTYASEPAAEEQNYPELDAKGVAIEGSYKPVQGKRERKPTQRLVDDAAQSPATRPAKRSSDSKESGQTKRARTSTSGIPAIKGEGSAALPDRTRTRTPARQPSSDPLSSRFPGLVKPDMRRREHTPQEADRGSLDTSSANKGKGKGKAKSGPSNQAAASARPSATPSRETPSRATPAPNQQQPAEEESVTTSGRKSKRSTQGKPPKRLDDEVEEHVEEERQSRSPSGPGNKNKSGYGANQNRGMDATGPNYGESGTSFFNPHDTAQQGPAPASATKKNNKSKAPRKSTPAEADSPVTSIEGEGQNEDDVPSSQKTVVDPEIAEAMRKREEARKAKSEKMKAITKARWASGEMHTVMEKKKANNALKKAALNAGGHAMVAIAPAPLAMAPKAPAQALAAKGTGIGRRVEKGSVSQSPAPVTPTLGSFSSKSKAKTTKPESKKEPRTKQLAKSEAATGSSSRRSNSRGLSNEMDGANSEDDDDSDDGDKPRKLTEYEMFLQISTPAGGVSESDGRPTRARSIAGVYEGRRSGRGGSLGGVGMERNNSDDGTSFSARRTPNHPSSVGGAGRKGKNVSKLSLYDQFQLLSSPTSAGSPAPRGRRPAALRAKQTFQSFGMEDEVDEGEEERVAYAGPPVHMGHSRNYSGISLSGSQSAKKDAAKLKGNSTAMVPPKMAKVKKEEVELGEEEDSEEDSEDDGPKKKSAYDMWQDIINNGGEVPEGEKRKRVGNRRSDVK